MKGCKWHYGSKLGYCGNPVLTQPDKSNPSIRLHFDNGTNEGGLLYLWPTKPKSKYCYYHDKIVHKLMELTNEGRKSHYDYNVIKGKLGGNYGTTEDERKDGNAINGTSNQL